MISSCIQLVAELDFLLEDTPEKDLSETQTEQYKDTINELQQLLSSKLDAATVLLLKVCNQHY